VFIYQKDNALQIKTLGGKFSKVAAVTRVASPI
jgi:hypothetical protein